jgi:hypothetical protein
MRNLFVTLITVTCAAACGSDDIDSNEEARRAYLGLDGIVAKSLTLGMIGYGEASNANIPDQMTTGDVTGTLDVSGHVDAGESVNHEMNLTLALTNYSDGPLIVDDEQLDIDITYATDPLALPAISLSLRDIPEGTFTGTLIGDFSMTGDIEGTVHLNLAMSGEIESDGTELGVQRVVGTTHVTGTATSGDGTYEVDITL